LGSDTHSSPDPLRDRASGCASDRRYIGRLARASSDKRTVNSGRRPRPVRGGTTWSSTRTYSAEGVSVCAHTLILGALRPCSAQRHTSHDLYGITHLGTAAACSASQAESCSITHRSPAECLQAGATRRERDPPVQHALERAGTWRHSGGWPPQCTMACRPNKTTNVLIRRGFATN